MGRAGEIIHYRHAKKGGCRGILPPAVIILAEHDIKVKSVTVGIFDTGSQLGHKVILCVEDIANSRRKCVCELTLLEDVEIRTEFHICSSISAFHWLKGCFPHVKPETEHVPLAAQFECKVGLSG